MSVSSLLLLQEIQLNPLSKSLTNTCLKSEYFFLGLKDGGASRDE